MISSTVLSTLSGDGLFGTVIGLMFALFGYRMSVRFRQVRGVTPWRLPSIVWALICLFFVVFGLLLEFVAQFTTRADMPSAMFSQTPTYSPFASHGDSSQGEAIAQAPTTLSSASTPALADPADSPPRYAPPTTSDGKVAPFGWYNDVTGRHTTRYWDGKGWQDLVSDDGGEIVRDPISL